MASLDEELQTLTHLGLTRWQAKVYLALTQSGIATVKTVSKVSEIPRQHIYKIVSTLQELGLVEEAVTSPLKFIAIPMSEGLSILLERKSKEYNELQAETINMLKNSSRNNANVTYKEEEPQFVMIPSNDATHRWCRTKIEATQTMDCLISMEGFDDMIYNYAEIFKKALKKGIKLRIIAQKPEDEKSLTVIAPAIKKNPNFKIRYIFTQPPATISLWDKKEALVSTVPTNAIKAPALWSNNPGFVVILNEYFEEMWVKALEEIPKNTNPVTSY